MPFLFGAGVGAACSGSDTVSFLGLWRVAFFDLATRALFELDPSTTSFWLVGVGDTKVADFAFLAAFGGEAGVGAGAVSDGVTDGSLLVVLIELDPRFILCAYLGM